MRILLIKLTSLGDLIHALPALSDAREAFPDIEFDWVIDENFQEVALWHPAVKRHFTANHRKWRKNLRDLSTYQSMYRLFRELRQTKYDLIIDGQGNHKSALLSLFAKGVSAGYDQHSIRERIAHFAYQKKFKVSKEQHAIARLRSLFAQSLGYPLPNTEPNFGIDVNRFKKPNIELPDNFLVFVHNASWNTKLWPEVHWESLIKKSIDSGHTILLPWGNKEEEARAHRLAAIASTVSSTSHSSPVQVLPRLSLSEIGYVLAKARGCVCMDTGLSHLTAALNIPSLTLYGATDSGLIGASGGGQQHIQSTLACAPCQKKSCRYPNSTNVKLNPPCLAEITPERVFEFVETL